MNLSLFDSFPDGIMILDEALNIEYVNEASLEILGISSKRQLIQKKITDKFPDLKDYFNKPIRDYFMFSEVEVKSKGQELPLTLYIGCQKLTESSSFMFYIRNVSAEVNLHYKFNKATVEKQKAIEASLLDSLTGCLNKKGLFEALDNSWKKVLKDKIVFSVMVIDMDNFKRVNDNYGHQAGDKYIKAFGSYLTKILRSEQDIVGRFGGDEFVVISQNCSSEEIGNLAKRLIKSVGNYEVEIGEDKLSITLSVGVCTYHKDFNSWEEMLKKADEGVYLAKGAGKNTWSFGK